MAETMDLFSPDRQLYVDVGRDSQDLFWQIVIVDALKGSVTLLINEGARARGIGSYHPAWSPTDFNKIVYVSDQPGSAEIHLYDFQTHDSKRLTFTPPDPKRGYPPFNKHPSWSPDGKEIVFFSDREGDPPRTQIWIMAADGSNLRNLSRNTFNDWDPVWVK